MIMFCGLPVGVATEPALAPKHTASRYGSGGSLASRQHCSTSGVTIRHTVSLTSTADKSPATATTATSRVRALLTCISVRYEIVRKTRASTR